MNAMETAKTINQKTKPEASQNVGETERVASGMGGGLLAAYGLYRMDLIGLGLAALGGNVVKIVVTHHPFDLPEGFDDSELVGRAKMAMNTLADCGADVFLAGHLHVSHTGHTAKRYKIGDHSALVVQAGTATSTRGRGEANSFNVIRIDYPKIVVERFVWQPAQSVFISNQIEKFQQVSNGWTRIAD